MKATVDFLMVTQLNQILKDKGIEYSLHTVGGCACCGLKLKCDGQQHDIDDIVYIINDYLSSRWLIASYQETDLSMLYIDSKFDQLQKEDK